jgi:diguanylate cyclase (GGDEF)-like protein/PAS domain S-box-containing protein
VTSGINILVVDDNPNNLQLLHELLSAEGYHVRAALSGELGLSASLQKIPDLILLDVRMPEMDGFEVCSILKSDERTADIPVIFISAASESIDKVRAFEIGAVDYINKPFSTHEVLARVDTHLRLSLLQKQTRKSLQTSQYVLESTLNNSPTMIHIKDMGGHYMMVNKLFEEVYGMKQDDIQGKTDDEVFAREIAEKNREKDDKVIREDRQIKYEEGIAKQGQTHTYLSQKFLLKDSDKTPFAICGISTDITDRKQAEEELQHLATYDTLTELPNRTLFLELMSRAIISARRNRQKHAVLFIDLDNFKNINDSLGHHVGDMLLKDVAKRLRNCTRGEDVISRFGGDEFTILLPNIRNPTDAAEVSNKIIEELTPPFKINGHDAFITPSIGIAVYPDNGKDAQDLLRNADAAMYHVKRRGRHGFQFFTEEMNEEVINRMEIEEELQNAHLNGVIKTYYQPIINTQSKKIVVIEALSRWQSEKLGTVAPDRFIPIAEQSNLIISLDRQTLRRAMSDIKPWLDNKLYDGKVSVNLTARQFLHDTLLEYIDEIVSELDFPPEHLEIEITEGTVMEDTEQVIGLMHKIRDRGIHLAIDDFGTGYSSLSYLKRFPVNTLKIDASFIKDITTSEKDKSMVASIISLSRNMDLNVMAEGVELTGQAEILQELGCNVMQGYLFSQAIDCSAMAKIIEDKRNIASFH